LLLTVAVGSVLLVSLTVLPLLLQPPSSGPREMKSAFASGDHLSGG